jgi:hypothetical protein
MAIDKVTGTSWADLSKISDVAKADIAKVAGQDAPSGSGIVTSSLIHHYDASLSGGATSTQLVDQGSGAYNLTYRNGVAQPTGGSVWVAFDGTNDYTGTVDSTPSTMVPVDLSDSYTWSAFYDHDSKNGTQCLFGSFERFNDYTFVGLYISYSTTNSNYSITAAARHNNSHVQYWRASGLTANPAQATFTHDGSRTEAGGTIYINGVAQTTSLIINTGSGSSVVDYSFSTFGQGADDNQLYYYDGLIGECLMYDAELTAAQVLQNYNASKTKHGL